MMDKKELKRKFVEIDDYFQSQVGTEFTSSELEFMRSYFREILGEEQPAYITLTYDERSMLTDMDYHDAELDLAWDGDDFIATKENIEALERVIDSFKEKIMKKVKNTHK